MPSTMIERPILFSRRCGRISEPHGRYQRPAALTNRIALGSNASWLSALYLTLRLRSNPRSNDRHDLRAVGRQRKSDIARNIANGETRETANNTPSLPRKAGSEVASIEKIMPRRYSHSMRHGKESGFIRSGTSFLMHTGDAARVAERLSECSCSLTTSITTGLKSGESWATTSWCYCD